MQLFRINKKYLDNVTSEMKSVHLKSASRKMKSKQLKSGRLANDASSDPVTVRFKNPLAVLPHDLRVEDVDDSEVLAGALPPPDFLRAGAPRRPSLYHEPASSCRSWTLAFPCDVF